MRTRPINGLVAEWASSHWESRACDARERRPPGPCWGLHSVGSRAQCLAVEPKSWSESQHGGTFLEAARRRQIVDAAIETLAEVGYAAATLGEIAKRAGISRGLISYHFAGKAELIAKVLFAVYVEGAEAMGPRIAAESTPSGQLRAYVQSNLDYMRDKPQRMAAVAAVLTGGGLSEELPGVGHEAADRSIIETLAGILRNGQAVGEFREFDAVVAARAIRNMIDGVATQLSRDRALDVDHQAREILGFVVAATAAVGWNEGLS